MFVSRILWFFAIFSIIFAENENESSSESAEEIEEVIPVFVDFENLEIAGAQKLGNSQKIDVLRVLKDFPRIFNSTAENLKILVPEMFAENSTMFCSGLQVTPRKYIELYLKHKSRLNDFSIQNVGIHIYPDGTVKCSGFYIWNQIALRKFIITFVEENGHQKIDFAIIVGC
ncbi:unnamed protein product [Caenorhabditis angaria]|uniref:Uncharacterized protein n=1 Tax=Caenorhabditis angaria TaxID=860376 RepID=A0A9P1IKC0_9PELO|nr:unnamed protein product [Caenorhabditis angaria]